MRIKRIIVEKLFGLDDNDFDIECFPNEYVTILYAFNGIGKTTLLRLLDAVLNKKMQILDSIPFKKIQVIFNNNDFVLVEKLGDYKKEFMKTKCEDLFFIDPDTPVYPIKYTIKYASKKGDKTKEYYLRLSESFAIEVKKSPKMTVDTIKEVDPLKSEKIKKLIRSFEIPTDTYKPPLYKGTVPANVDAWSYLEPRCYIVYKAKDGIKPVDTLLFSNFAFVFFDLDDLMNFKFSTGGYAKLMLANKQFKEFPPREKNEPKYLMFRNYPPMNDNDYLTDENLEEISYFSKWIEKKGGDVSKLPQLTIIRNRARDVCVAVKIMLRNNSNIEELEYYLRLINDEFGFMFKNIKLDKEKGLKVVPLCDDDPELDVWQLSSGEKNLIILFYELLFDSAPIVFIDEPETSLHISWQSKLIKNILEVCKKKSIQAIVSTHSPDVIDEYEDISTEMISKRYKYGDKYFEN